MGEIRNIAETSFKVTESTLTEDVTVSTARPSWQDSGLSVSFTTSLNEVVMISYHGTMFSNIVDNGAMSYGYKIDSDTTVGISEENVSEQNHVSPICFSVPTVPLSLGSHTVKFMVSRGSAGNITLRSTTSQATAEHKLRVIQI